MKLPPVNSFSIDFLGYYNNSIDLPNLGSLENKFPTSYYYRDQFEKSLLPFPIPNKVVTKVIPGYFNREANNYSKSWSLIKIELPTNGTKEFIYEPNDFEEFNENIIGGGIRIKQQKINDDFGNIRTINYAYTKDNGKSSGSLSTIPFLVFLQVLYIILLVIIVKLVIQLVGKAQPQLLLQVLENLFGNYMIEVI